MGVVNDLDVRMPVEHAVHTVGALSMTMRGSATLITRLGVAQTQGPGMDRWGYGEEIPVTVRFNHLERAAVENSVDEVFWAGIEVLVTKRALETRGLLGLPELHITAALRPLSLMWFLHAPLKRGCASERDRHNAVAQLARGEKTFGQLAFDPLLADPDMFMARLGDPLRPNWEDPDTVDTGDGWWQNRNVFRNASLIKPECTAREGEFLPPTRCWYFGLSPVVPSEVVVATAAGEKCRALVDGSDSRPVRRGRGLVAAGGNGGAVGGSGGAVDWADRKQMGEQANIVRPDNTMAERIVEAAIRQAMAGRCEGGASMDSWIERHFRDMFSNMAGRMDRAVEAVPAVAGDEERIPMDVVELRLAAFSMAHRIACPRCLMLPVVGSMTRERVWEVLAFPGDYLNGCRMALVEALEG